MQLKNEITHHLNNIFQINRMTAEEMSVFDELSFVEISVKHGFFISSKYYYTQSLANEYIYGVFKHDHIKQRFRFKRNTKFGIEIL